MQSAKILWGEGLFLRPQHFQQQDAYAEALSRHALMTAQPFAWGVKDLALDIEALKTGTLRFNRIDVVMSDGTSFTAPDIDQLPPPVALDALVSDQGGITFHLAIHQLKNHGGNCVEGSRDGSHARFLIEPKDTADLFTDAADAQITYLSKLAYLKAASEPRDQYATLPLLRIRRTSSDGFERDPAFLPPATSLRSAPLLYLMLRRQIDALRAKVDALYGFHREPSQNIIEFRSGDIASFWLLHTASSACAALTHLFRNPDIHPERLFQELLRLAGGLMTFSKHHALDDLPAYEHGAPGACFTQLDKILRDLLDTVISTRYFSIALTQPKPAFHAGRLDSEKIASDTTFYLSVSAAHPQSELIESVPLRLKVGAPDDVEKLVLSAMSGVRISHAAQVPAAIPVRPGASYFALDTTGALYERMLKAQSIMIYAPESYQDLKLELIAVTP
ncbi:type VI secretion system baseplate subunit TssK [Denitromonas ohlonensis]|uniref:Type VI secretion system baseplate subunit TssK n=2 Tax=Denitromonas TaxID=139331 RepID=A0A557REB2_9RHOO|nr:type VI secretion system baseplate subunit TssK [Denitromonas ohlonensis]TVO63459.1 type VI secretion system baseplate subunit TssK [Denitromonas ohlonensis]TVO75336.1 type VI secretion system baseplate subunit TssK [Denitromonas ohlonensis]TVT44569.1 MAG: type VI secretion system baseplate subunit TssK [Denitromonas halophila]TVT68035.1 MAG: type VI secretion system baseplate subunit TssK [Denitromonas halophila]